MVTTTDKIDVLIYNGGAGSRPCGNGITAKELRKNLTERLTDYKGDIDKVIEKVVDIGVPYINDQLNLDGVEARLRIVVLDWFFNTYGLVINEPYNHRLTHSLFTDLKNEALSGK